MIAKNGKRVHETKTYTAQEFVEQRVGMGDRHQGRLYGCKVQVNFFSRRM